MTRSAPDTATRTTFNASANAFGSCAHLPKRGEASSGVSEIITQCALLIAILVVLALVMVISLWLASFFLYASFRLNPLHAGFWGWCDVWLLWREGGVPQGARHLAGAALLALLVSVGLPAMALYTVWERTARRSLHGSARFASEAEIRAAGLF